MSAVAINKKNELEDLVAVIKKMSDDNEFCGKVINAKNLGEFLAANGFIVNQEGIKLLQGSVIKIKDMVNGEVKGIIDELLEVVAITVSGCNGTCW